MIRRLLVSFFPGAFLGFLRTKRYRRIQFVGEYEKMIQRINKAVFIREKLKETREDIRREYDKVTEDLDAVRASRQREGLDEAMKAALDRAIEGKERDIAQLKTQIDQIDKQIDEPGGTEDMIQSYRAILPLLERLIRRREKL